MSAEVLKSIKNGTALFDTGINKTYSQRELQSIFASQYVNSGAFLDTPEQKRLYEVFDGNHTIKSKKPIEQAPYKPAHICKYENVMVYTDFPKGASHSDTTHMWEDGTYDDMMASVHKQNDEVPGIFPINAPLRQTIMNLAEMTGGRLEDSIYKYKQTLTEDREQALRLQLAEGGATQDEIDHIISLQKAEEDTVKKGSAGAYLMGRAKDEYTKLLAGRLRPVTREERLWLSPSLSDSMAIQHILNEPGMLVTESHIKRLIAQADAGNRKAQTELNQMIAPVVKRELPKDYRQTHPRGYTTGSEELIAHTYRPASVQSIRAMRAINRTLPPGSITNPISGTSIDSAGVRLAVAIGNSERVRNPRGGESMPRSEYNKTREGKQELERLMLMESKLRQQKGGK